MFIYYAIWFSLCVFEMWLVLNFCSHFLKVKECMKKHRYLIVLLIATIEFVINQLGNNNINLIGNFIITMFMIFVICQGKILTRMLYTIIAYLILMGCELLFSILYSFSATDNLKNYLTEDYHLLVAIIIKLLSFVVYTLIKQLTGSKDKKLPLKFVVMFSVTPVTSLFVFFSIFNLNIDFSQLIHMKYILIVSCGMLLFCNALNFYVLEKLNLSICERKSLETQKMIYDMKGHHYKELEKINKEHRSILHDVKKNMRIIGMLAQRSNTEQIESILEEMDIRIKESGQKVYTTYDLLNAILLEREQEAERCHITYKVDISPDFYFDFVNDYDVVAMLGNLLDNAIEGASLCAKGWITIDMYMANKNQFVMIDIANSYDGKVLGQNGRLMTRKQERREEHGIGIAIVKKTVEKYGGCLEIEYTEREFKASLLLPVIHN